MKKLLKSSKKIIRELEEEVKCLKEKSKAEEIEVVESVEKIERAEEEKAIDMSESIYSMTFGELRDLAENKQKQQY